MLERPADVNDSLVTPTIEQLPRHADLEKAQGLQRPEEELVGYRAVPSF
jgi:hypothetical protein